MRSLVNLAINARDAIGPGGGRLAIEVGVRRDPDLCRRRRWIGSHHARIRVWDTGPGIPREIAPRIFEPFFSTKSPERGTGMGLSVVHTVIAAYQGTIEYVELEGRGACFDILLPLFRGGVDDDEPTRVMTAAGEARSSEPLKGMRLLVADDEPTLRLLLAEALGVRGADVVTVSDGVQAVERLEAASGAGTPFHAAIIDFHMPGLGGLETLRRARALDADLHLVLCSGMAPSSELTDELLAMGAQFLPKPFRLGEAVDALLSR